MDHWRGFHRVEVHGHGLSDGWQRHHQPADHACHAGNATVPEYCADAHSPQVHTVAVPILTGGEVVGGLGHAINIDGGRQIIFIDGSVPEGVLHSINCDGTGVHHPLHFCPTSRLEDIVGALDVHQHAEVDPLFRVRR